MFIIIWKFKPINNFINEFETAYGPNGAWSELFSRVNGFLGTSLLKELESDNIYLAVDRWDSKETFLSFKQRYFNEYNSLDEHFKSITEFEMKVGEFLTK